MVEPENQTLRLLRDVRGAVQSIDTNVDVLSTKVDASHHDTTERFKSLQQAIIGESVLGRYTVAEVEDRLDTIEKRLAALEKQR